MGAARKWDTIDIGREWPREVPVVGLRPWRVSEVNYMAAVGAGWHAERLFRELIQRTRRCRRGRWWWK